MLSVSTSACMHADGTHLPRQRQDVRTLLHTDAQGLMAEWSDVHGSALTSSLREVVCIHWHIYQGTWDLNRSLGRHLHYVHDGVHPQAVQ